MTYKELLEIAGATVSKFNLFGDYQGTYIALVEHNGKQGWVIDVFGSCSGCDELEHFIDELSHNPETGMPASTYSNNEHWNEDGYTKDSKCPYCRQAYYRLVELGKQKLKDMFTQQQAIDYAKNDMKWDLEAKSMFDWLSKNRIGDFI